MTSSLPFAEVIGDPIDQSLSPIIHGFWLDALGIAGEYRRRRVAKGELESYLKQVRGDLAWRGSNVTMPLKLEALTAADEASDDAFAAGAANLLLPRDGKLIAGNSDVGAIERLVGKLGEQAGSVTLFGNGGAARAALVALNRLGLKDVVIQARDQFAARKLAVEFGLDHAPRDFLAPVESNGLINTTPLGMPGRDCLNCELGAMPAGGWVFDMVTGPSPLIAAAAARGLRTIRGIEMLVEQAGDSFEAMFGVRPPRDRDAELMLRLKP